MLNDDHLLFNIFHAVIIIIKDVNLQHKLYEENNSWNKTDWYYSDENIYLLFYTLLNQLRHMESIDR